MKPKNLVILFLFTFLIFGSNGYAQFPANSAIQEARQLIQELMQHDDIPGLSVSVSKDGKLVRS